MTTQVMDTFYFEGHQYRTSAEPLECHPQLPVFLALSTANHKGYEATWSVVAGKLFLVALAGVAESTSEQDVSTVFPGCSGPVFAEWFSGKIDIQSGRIVEPAEFNPLFEHQIALTFRSGRVVSKERLERKFVPGHKVLDPILFRPISDLDELTGPVIELLEAGGIHRVGDLVQMKASAFMRVPGMGASAMELIEEGLAIRGLTITMSLPGWRAD
mgnify:CR=1 FL=1